MLVKPEDRKVVGHLPGEKFAMRIDEGSAISLMDLLGKGIYKDPELAVLREYTCNARDSHDEAGNTDPVEVQLPTTLSPFLKIIDHGVGLSAEEVIRFLSYYGASTKRVAGNTQTGSLGIGGKSGFAYSDQFNIVAVKDGQRTVVSASLSEEGGGEFTIVDEAETDDLNGVEIQIPAKRWNEFGQKAQKLFQYWPRGSVLVSGQEIEPITEKDGVQRIADDLYMTQKDYVDESVVVMCNVPYTVKTAAFGVELPHNRQIIAYVGVDAVDFEGAREQLRMTKKTKDTLEAIGRRFLEEIQKSMQAEIDQCPNALEAIRMATKWYLATPEKLRPKAWTYLGREIPREFAIGQPDPTTGARPRMTVVKRNSYGKQKDHSKAETIPFTTAIKAQWFYGYDLQFTGGHRRRIDEWARQKREADPTWEYPEIYVLANAKVISEYLDPTRITDWEEVRKVKMPNQERADNGRLLGSYDVLTNGSYDHEMLADDIDDAEPVYYFVGEANKNLRWTASRTQLAAPYHALLRTLEPNCTTVLIPQTREAKLLRTFPQAQKVQDAVKGLFQEWLDGLSDDEQLALYIHDTDTEAYNRLKALDATRIDDPSLKDKIELVQRVDLTKLSRELDKYRAVERKSHSSNTQLTATWHNPLEPYELLRHFYSTPKSDHLYIYLNAAYAAMQEKAAAEVEAMVEEELEAVAA